jgi:hypothetical protein
MGGSVIWIALDNSGHADPVAGSVAECRRRLRLAAAVQEVVVKVSRVRKVSGEWAHAQWQWVHVGGALAFRPAALGLHSSCMSRERRDAAMFKCASAPAFPFWLYLV